MPNDKKGETTLDDLAQMITRSFDGMMRYMQENFATKKDIEMVEKNLSGRMDKVEERLGRVEEGISVLGNKVVRIERKVESMTSAIQEKMSEQEEDLRRVKAKMGIIA